MRWSIRWRAADMLGGNGRLRKWAVAGVVTAGVLVAQAVAAQDVTIFAAASLKNALDNIGAAWTAGSGKKAVISYAASSALAKQIEEGAPADIFVSADLAWMTYLSERNLTRKENEVELLGNRIVLVAPAASAVTAAIGPGFDLKGLLGDGQARHGERRGGARRQVRQGGADIARCLGQRRGPRGANGERASGAGARLHRRGAARHRLPDRRVRRPEGEGPGHTSRRTATRRSSIRPPRWPSPRTPTQGRSSPT